MSITYLVNELGDLIKRQAAMTMEIAALEIRILDFGGSQYDLADELRKQQQLLSDLQRLLAVDSENMFAPTGIATAEREISRLETEIANLEYAENKLESLKNKREQIEMKIESLRSQIESAAGG